MIPTVSNDIRPTTTLAIVKGRVVQMLEQVQATNEALTQLLTVCSNIPHVPQPPAPLVDRVAFRDVARSLEAYRDTLEAELQVQRMALMERLSDSASASTLNEIRALLHVTPPAA